MSEVKAIALFAMRESLRRRVFVVVGILTVAFLALFALGTSVIHSEVSGTDRRLGIDAARVAAAWMLGFSMFATLFLGAVLAVFLTLGAVRGDAERGLLQPVLVRPVSRRALLAGRFAAAGGVCAVYAMTVFTSCVVITRITSDWWPDRVLVPVLALALAVTLIAAVSLAGSVFLAATANGIAVLMVFGGGLLAGILGQIAEALSSHTLKAIASIASWALPFEALYQRALSDLTADTVGFTKLAVKLGPFGGAQPTSSWLFPWALIWLAATAALAARGFARRDL